MRLIVKYFLINCFNKIFILENSIIMSKKILILSQKQLNEIVGGNGEYLDNLDGDFAEDANNQVYSTGKLEKKDGKPVTTDDISDERYQDSWYPGGIGGTKGTMTYLHNFLSCSKKEWKKKNLSEENQNLVNNTYGDDKNRVSNTNASTLKWRYGAAKKKAMSEDPTIRQQGISTMKTMEKNNPNLSQIEAQYDAAMANDDSIKQMQKERGEENVFQKPGGTKKVNGTAHTKKNKVTITYDN